MQSQPQPHLPTVGSTVNRPNRVLSHCKFRESAGLGISQATPQSDIVMLQKGALSGTQSDVLPPAPVLVSQAYTKLPDHVQDAKFQSHDDSARASSNESYSDKYSMGQSFREPFSIAESYTSQNRFSEEEKDKLKQLHWSETIGNTRDTADSYAMLGSSFGSTRESRMSRLSRFSSDSHL